MSINPVKESTIIPANLSSKLALKKQSQPSKSQVALGAIALATAGATAYFLSSSSPTVQARPVKNYRQTSNSSPSVFGENISYGSTHDHCSRLFSISPDQQTPYIGSEKFNELFSYKGNVTVNTPPTNFSFSNVAANITALAIPSFLQPSASNALATVYESTASLKNLGYRVGHAALTIIPSFNYSLEHLTPSNMIKYFGDSFFPDYFLKRPNSESNWFKSLILERIENGHFFASMKNPHTSTGDSSSYDQFGYSVSDGKWMPKKVCNLRLWDSGFSFKKAFKQKSQCQKYLRQIQGIEQILKGSVFRFKDVSELDQPLVARAFKQAIIDHPRDIHADTIVIEKGPQNQNRVIKEYNSHRLTYPLTIGLRTLGSYAGSGKVKAYVQRKDLGADVVNECDISFSPKFLLHDCIEKVGLLFMTGLEWVKLYELANHEIAHRRFREALHTFRYHKQIVGTPLSFLQKVALLGRINLDILMIGFHRFIARPLGWPEKSFDAPHYIFKSGGSMKHALHPTCFTDPFKPCVFNLSHSQIDLLNPEDAFGYAPKNLNQKCLEQSDQTLIRQ